MLGVFIHSFDELSKQQSMDFIAPVDVSSMDFTCPDSTYLEKNNGVQQRITD